jgi:hypothetical protein
LSSQFGAFTRGKKNIGKYTKTNKALINQEDDQKGDSEEYHPAKQYRAEC